jgi:hypothetical protein
MMGRQALASAICARPSAFERELLRSGRVVGVLPTEFVRREILLIRQFRLGGRLALDRGEIVESLLVASVRASRWKMQHDANAARKPARGRSG